MNHHTRSKARLAAAYREQAARHGRMVRDFLDRGWVAPAKADAIEAWRCAVRAEALDPSRPPTA